MDTAIKHLITTGDRFYAEILLQMNRVWTIDPQVPTIGVSLQKTPATLLINTNFWRLNPSIESRVFFLKHECAHIIANHGARTNGPFTPLHNIAADIAVHELIGTPREPVIGLSGDPFPLQTRTLYLPQIPDLAEDQTMEYYYEALEKAGEGEGEGMDVHGGLEATTELQRAVARSMVQRAVGSARQGGQSVPDELRNIVDGLLNTRIDWRRELRSLPDYAEVAYTESSRRIRNRRYGLQYPGEKKIRRVKIAVGFDVSGSIDDSLATLLGAEIAHIVEGGAEVDIVFFDDAVREVRPWSADFLSNGIPGGGGTCFQPALDKGVALGADGIIMLTDGCNFDTLADPGVPVIWGILPGFKFSCTFGTVVEISDEKAAR